MKKQPWRYNKVAKGNSTPVEKDIVIAKLQGQLAYLKSFVMTDEGIFCFPDGEFLYGCGIQKRVDASSLLEQKIAKLQTDLDDKKMELGKVEHMYQLRIEKLQEDYNRRGYLK